MAYEELLRDVSGLELETWRGKRSKGRPNARDKESFDRRDQVILQIALGETASYSQTVRRIYYVCSGLGVVHKDHGSEDTGYKAVAEALQKFRWSGDLPWESIVDGTRELVRYPMWNDADDFLKSVKPQFRTDFWRGQKERPIVVFEKDTLSGMLGDVCSRYQVPNMSFHGQISDSGLYMLAQYIVSLEGQAETVWLYYLGDYDPSGLTIDGCVFDSDRTGERGRGNGKIFGLLRSLGMRSVKVQHTRLGIKQCHLDFPEYQSYILPASKTDTNYKNFMALTKGDDRTLGIDAMDHATLEAVVEGAIKSSIDSKEAWETEQLRYKTEKATL